MNPIGKSDVTNQNRRQLLWRAAFGTMGIAAAGSINLLSSQLAAASAGQGAATQLSGIGRVDLIQDDLGVPGREAVQALVTIPAGAAAPRHSHPGEEIAYVVEGSLEYALDGRPPVIVKAGEALFIPYGVPHAVKNVGSGKAVELATYFADKGKPLFVLEK
jgi:quercetin dioxygenase-like cupin family protein